VLCGLVACLIQAQPSFTNMQLLQAVEQSASQASNPDSLMGYGIPDFCAANLTLGGTIPAQEDALYNIAPVPFGEELNFSFYSTSNQELHITLYDSRGRKLLDQQVFAVANAENHYRLTELGAVTTGVYILQVRSEDGTFTQKVVKGQ
jgi:serine protease AprX